MIFFGLTSFKFCVYDGGDIKEKIKKADKWWRDADQSDTPEGNKKYLDFYESDWTMKGDVVFK